MGREFQGIDTAKKFLNQNPEFHPGQRCTRANMNTCTIKQILATVLLGTKTIRIAEYSFVTIGGCPQNGDFLAGGNLSRGC